MIAPELGAVEWLVGEWDAEPEPSGATGGSTFTVVAGGHALLRTSWAQYPAAPDRAASRHDDVLLLYAESGGLHGLYADNEGHVIRYAVDAGGSGVVLTSDGGPGPRFRLTYARTGQDAATVDFEIAPPGGDFRRYVGGRVRRVR